MSQPTYVIGTPVSGDDFWGREEKIQSIRTSLRRNSVLLTAPRRFGKTSVMIHLRNNPRYGWDYIYLDVEDGINPRILIDGLLEELIDNMAWLWERILGTSNLIQNSVDGVKIVTPEGSTEIKISDNEDASWQERGEKLITELEKAEPRLVIMVDELPVLIRCMYEDEDFKSTKEFLYWFRKLRQKRDGVKWIVGGSIGLKNVIQYVGAYTDETINDLERKEISAFSEKEAREYIQALIANEEGISNIDREVLNGFLETLGEPIPFFLQILVKEVMKKVDNKKELCRELIKETYKDKLLSSSEGQYLNYYDDRIEKRFHPDRRSIARDLLTHTAREGNLSPKDAREIFKENRKSKVNKKELSSLLMKLIHEYYLRKDRDSGNYKFAAKPIKDWWLENRCV